jgi:oligopeptide/dipeptide ABC transporter ATP-binding protein
VIADEPTTALDVTVQASILRLLRRLRRTRGTSILLITHNLGVVAEIADRVYVMYAGIMVESGTVEQIFSDPLHPYTMGLLASLPHRAKKGRPLYSIPGNVPDPAFKPPGCPFHPRCPYARPECRQQMPSMSDFTAGHQARCPVTHGLWHSGRLAPPEARHHPSAPSVEGAASS